MTLYGVMGAVSGVLMGLIVGIGAAIMLAGEMNWLLQEAGRGDFGSIVRIIMDSDIMNFVIIGTVLGSVFGMGIGILIMRRILPEKNNIPIPKKNLSFPDFLLVIMMAFGLWGVGAFLGNLPEWFGIGLENELFSSTRPIMIIFHLYAIFGAPFFEELAFRKTLLDAAHPYGEIPAAFLSALLFGLMHGNSAQFLLAFTLGLLLSAVYMRTGRVIYTMFLHFMINLTATVPSFFEMAGINIDIPWYFVVGTLTVAGIVLLIIFRKKEFLSLSESAEPDPNASAFKNVGMRIAVIGGLVLIAGYEAIQFVGCIASGFGPEVLLRLVPLALTVAVIILVLRLVGKPRSVAQAMIPEMPQLNPQMNSEINPQDNK